jgi:RNA polymerase-interacting CarD/CdnL/TRCF family regulator
MEIQMMLTVGQKVVYPGRGPCFIGAVVQKVVCGKLASFYRLAVLDDSKAEVFIPVDNFHDLRVRALLDRSEIPKLLGRLKIRARVTKDLATANNWRQRNQENLRLCSSGSIFDLADVIESLTLWSRTKTLSPHQRETLDRARKLLVCEISEVLEESKSAAEARIDRVLGPAQA